jgi:Icc-related predicted phosphoesterase
MRTKSVTSWMFCLTAALLGIVPRGWGQSTEKQPAAANHIALELRVGSAYRFVAFGDTRFHDPADTEAANPAVRHALVEAIDKEKPEFVSIGGDIVYNGENGKDWEVWDSETAAWKQSKIPVYPTLGNHDLKGNEAKALSNYFARFPDLQESRFYSVKLGKSVMLVLDSALDEIGGTQGDWLKEQLGKVSPETPFVFMVFHHPPYTSSSDEKQFGGGHTARGTEKALAQLLEERQKQIRARIIVFSGHVHNYERHEHNGVTYFVTGGGGAHAYPVPRTPDDLYQDKGINYHYLLVVVDGDRATITMNKVDFMDGKAVWTKPDERTIVPPNALPAAASAAH